MSTKANALKIFRAAVQSGDYAADDAFELAIEYAAKFDKAYPETLLTKIPPEPWQSLADGVPGIGQSCYVTTAAFESVARGEWNGEKGEGDEYNDFYNHAGDRVFGAFPPLRFAADRVFWCGAKSFPNVDDALDSLLAAKYANAASDAP